MVCAQKIACLKCKETAFITNSSIKVSSLVVTMHFAKGEATTSRSQPTINHMCKPTLLLSTGFLPSGSAFQRVRELYDFVNVLFIENTRYNNFPKLYLFPTINKV